MVILGIETSCDETSVAVLQDGIILSHLISSQWVHQQFGGIVPELASRAHLRTIVPICHQALDQSNLKIHENDSPISPIDAVAVTYAPGLVGSLLVGVNFAKALALSKNIPVIGIHHIEGHIWANFIENPFIQFPFLSLVISGGHTQLVLVEDLGKYKIIGETRDDAAGEAYDKVSKMLGLGYPGGPVIDRLAQTGDPEFIDFPRAMMNDGTYDFSFSGLKTAVLIELRKKTPEFIKEHVADICASFQAAVVDVLVRKAIQAAKHYHLSEIALAGGVSANQTLRQQLRRQADEEGLTVYIPSLKYCTDNAAMIAKTGEAYYLRGKKSDYHLNALPTLSLEKISSVKIVG